MAKNANLYIRVDQTVKNEAEQLFSTFGITVTDAVNMFLHKSLMVGGIPFDLIQPRYNAETEAAMREIDNMISGKIPQNPQRVESLFEELDIDVES